MSGIIFKLNNPLTISSSNFVTTTDNDAVFDSKDFDGLFESNVKFSLPQAVGPTDSVQFNKVTLSPNTLTVGTGLKTIVLKDGSISGVSPISFENNILVSENLKIIDNFTFSGTLVTGSSTIGSTQVTQSNNTGSTIWGESSSQKQFVTGSLDVTGSLLVNENINNIILTEISNDTSATDESSTALITEKAAFSFLSALKPQRNYLRKSFTHTGSFVNSSTSSFTTITASAPTGMEATSENDFMFFINGMLIENDALTIEQKTSTNLELRLDTSELGYSLESEDEVVGFGKFNS
jgi:hypothetical protein